MFTDLLDSEGNIEIRFSFVDIYFFTYNTSNKFMQFYISLEILLWIYFCVLNLISLIPSLFSSKSRYNSVFPKLSAFSDIGKSIRRPLWALTNVIVESSSPTLALFSSEIQHFSIKFVFQKSIDQTDYNCYYDQTILTDGASGFTEESKDCLSGWYLDLR